MTTETARDFETIKKYFDYFDDIKGGIWYNTNRTEKGIFLPSPINDIDYSIKHLLKKGIIKPGETIEDAGFGDARVLAVLNYHNLPSIGVEGDQQMFKLGRLNIRKLENLLTEAPISLIKGDFTDDKTYQEAGVKFRDIPVFFNFIDNYLELAKKIEKDSPAGTRFLLYGDSGLREERRPGLKLIDLFKTEQDSFMHMGVYVKQ